MDQMDQTNRIIPAPTVIRSRRDMLKGAGTALAALALTAASPMAAGRAYASELLAAGDDLTDIDILNFALKLEHLEATFYKQVVDSGVLSGNVLAVVTVIRDHEIAHVDFLTKALGSAAVGPDKYDFSKAGDLRTQAGVLAVAQKLEETGVGAYTGAAALIDSKAYLAAAASIEQVEARHAAAIRLLQGGPAAPMAYGPNLDVATVTALITPVLVS